MTLNFKQFPSQPALRRAAALALLLATGLAHAQFVWVDQKGGRHYSDQPPPPGTPPSRVLKAPGIPAPAVTVTALPTKAAAKPATPETKPVQPADAAAAAPDGAKPDPKKPQTWADREADYKKRQKEKQEADQKAQQQARTDAQKAEQCGEARKAKQTYDSGVRISDVGPDGQKRYLSDAERAQRSARANAAVADCR